MGGRVTAITYAPVKGLALVEADELELAPTGAPGDRRFHLIGEDGRLVNGKVAGPLVRVVARSDAGGSTLEVRLPDGSVVSGDVELGEPVETDFYGRPVTGRLVGGDYAEALSSFAGRPLRLVRVEDAGAGCDRGVDAAVSLVSQESLARLALEAGVEAVDRRRFRMLFEIAGLEPHEEDTWVGRRVALGEAVVRLSALVGRCAVTSHDPATGVRSLDTLRTIRRYRSDVESEEPLPFGVWGSVEQPGTVRLGDAVSAL